MELVTASDLLVTASVALLLSFLVAKLVSLAMTDTHNTTKHLILNDELVGPVIQTEQRLMVQSSETESQIGYISPIQVTTTTTTVNVETEQERRDATVESESDVSDVVVGLPMPVKKSEVVFELTEEKTVVRDDDFVEQRKEEFVEEIKEENLTETVVEREVNEGDEKKNDDDDDDYDWEWEGIERSEIEKVFMEATRFVSEKGFDDEVEMELYGLHKVAMEGPCRENQPMSLKLFARAKWNAWQKLGNMSPEVAMERYISILSDKFPEWMNDTSAGITEHEPAGSDVSESAALDLSSSLSHQQLNATERELEQESGDRDNSPLTESDSENNVKK